MIKKRHTLLIIEDNELNRDIIDSILSDEYDLLFANNGLEGMMLLREHANKINVVLLDIQMPVMDGYQVLEEIRNDEKLCKIPVIVTTATDRPDEEEVCLDLGATDFVLKPYNQKVVIKRVRNIIRLKESTTALNEIEVDTETGLLSRNAFLHYSSELLKKNNDTDFSLVMTDIKGFSNLLTKYGDSAINILKNEADAIKSAIPENSIAGRYYHDRFIVLMPSLAGSNTARKELYEDLYEKIRKDVKITLKMGVFENFDHSFDLVSLIEILKDSLKSIKSNYQQNICFVDQEFYNKMERRNYIEQSMESALKERKLEVYFQPKHRASDGKLMGAETLMRWNRSDIGFISPGEFIPIFEQTGFVVEADAFAWDETCRYLRLWIDKGINVVPISVNTSRLDYTIKNFNVRLVRSVREFRIDPTLLHIEVTESLFQGLSQDANRILEICRAHGVKVELDDFGTGYSSLHSLAELPIDIVKFDQSFVRKLDEKREQLVMKGCVDLVKSLDLSTVAEGVETEESRQLIASLGIDEIQGYYFSKPLPAAEFEEYLIKHTC